MIRRRTSEGDMRAFERCNRKIARRAQTVRPCVNCLRGEFADDDSEGVEEYIAKPKAAVAHIERPGGSEGAGSPWAIAVRMARGRQTYCGQPMNDSWVKVEEGALR